MNVHFNREAHGGRPPGAIGELVCCFPSGQEVSLIHAQTISSNYEQPGYVFQNISFASLADLDLTLDFRWISCRSRTLWHSLPRCFGHPVHPHLCPRFLYFAAVELLTYGTFAGDGGWMCLLVAAGCSDTSVDAHVVFLWLAGPCFF